MDKLIAAFPVLNQFRRLVYDNGQNDMDFTDTQNRLNKARIEVVNATTDLLRSSERLNAAALKALPNDGEIN